MGEVQHDLTLIHRDLGEVIDRAKNAHHRIDETNNAVREMREEVKQQLNKINTKVDNIGVNLANKDRQDRRWRKVTIVVAALAGAAFLGMFIKDSEVTKTIGEIAVKVGAGVASAI